MLDYSSPPPPPPCAASDGHAVCRPLQAAPPLLRVLPRGAALQDGRRRRGARGGAGGRRLQGDGGHDGGGDAPTPGRAGDGEGGGVLQASAREFKQNPMAGPVRVPAH